MLGPAAEPPEPDGDIRAVLSRGEPHPALDRPREGDLEEVEARQLGGLRETRSHTVAPGTFLQAERG